MNTVVRLTCDHRKLNIRNPEGRKRGGWNIRGSASSSPPPSLLSLVFH
ncbi:hypothetical protein B4135_2038 [Caldibacillus debilis]|uniref:Uncharacterized protein n=1 Tax=Caldibacillus debilis TaxID=301148 RepID=A0A150M455_9BACI|nr:hypothetical protein B4135_2038 [Caldibacillus debilis]